MNKKDKTAAILEQTYGRCVCEGHNCVLALIGNACAYNTYTTLTKGVTIHSGPSFVARLFEQPMDSSVCL